MLNRFRGRARPDESHEAEGDLQYERVVFFTDAVFAIAVTLLIIDLRVPDDPALHNQLNQNVISVLQNYGLLAGKMLAFLISFLVTSTYWIAHHRHFRYIKRYNNTLIWLNLLFLMSVVFIPFVTSVIGNYGNQPGVVNLYAASLAITGLMLVLVWLYATDHNRLVDPNLDRRFVRYFTWRAAVPPMIFLISIPIAHLFGGAPYLAMAFWPLVFITRPLLTRIYGNPE